jgi:sulfur carrier protein ThiS
VFATSAEAECEIGDFSMTKLQEFMEGERDFDDASTIEEFVEEVQVTPDRTVVDLDGRVIE